MVEEGEQVTFQHWAVGGSWGKGEQCPVAGQMKEEGSLNL